MQTRIYRFEIVRAIVNGVYEARDTENNSSVTLYEWTPPTPDRAAAKLRLAEVQDQLQGAVFTADASLYLIAPSPAAAREPLKTLHSRNLFTGIEPNGPQPPPQPPQAPQPPRTGDTRTKVVVTEAELKPPLPAPARPASSGNGWAWFIALVICAALAYAIGESRGKDSLSYLKYESSSLRNKLDTLNSTVHMLRIDNSTSSGVYVAVMYKNWAGVWVLSGWQGVAANTTAVVAASPVDDFYYTAYDPLDGAVWTGENPRDAYPVPRGTFVYFPIRGPRPSASLTKLIHVAPGLISGYSRLTRK